MNANTKGTQTQLRRIVALLFALAGLAERAAGRSWPARALVLWVLRQGEAVARDHVLALTGRVACAPAQIDLSEATGDAMRLAARFRALAAFVAAVAMAVMRAIARAPRAATLLTDAPAACTPRPRPVERRDSS